MSKPLDDLKAAVARIVAALKGALAHIAALNAEIAALKEQAAADKAMIEALTKELEDAMPDIGASMGGIEA